jgi:hypothetical protein
VLSWCVPVRVVPFVCMGDECVLHRTSLFGPVLGGSIFGGGGGGGDGRMGWIQMYCHIFGP